jgi:hypothetical protein
MVGGLNSLAYKINLKSVQATHNNTQLKAYPMQNRLELNKSMIPKSQADYLWGPIAESKPVKISEFLNNS